MNKRLGLLQAVGDQGWDHYIRAVKKCDRLWREEGVHWSVLGDQSSWHHTIEFLHDLVTENDLAALDGTDRKRVLGIVRRDGWDLLGSMRNNAVAPVFDDHCPSIQKILREVAEATDNAFPDIAFSAHEQLMSLEKVGQGIATRLLSLARPDRFVSVNGGSQHGLAQYSGLSPTALGGDKYPQLLARIYAQNWFQAPKPSSSWSVSIWGMRVALLDCFVYSEVDR